MSGGEDLSTYFNKSGCFCLNEDSNHTHNNLFMGDHTLYLQSDTDEQLILTFTFNQTVSMKSIVLGLPSDESCPQTIKLILNQPTIGFSDAGGSLLNENQ
jgi:hypothetical protein